MFYFKKRNYKVIENRKDLLAGVNLHSKFSISWGFNKSWSNPDSEILAAMGKQILCGKFMGTEDQMQTICRLANRWGRYCYQISREENESRFLAEDKEIIARIQVVLSNGGSLYGITFDRPVGIVTVENGRVDNLYIEGRFQRNGFGTRLLAYAFSIVGSHAFIDVPQQNNALLRVCEKIGLKQAEEANNGLIRMVNPL